MEGQGVSVCKLSDNKENIPPPPLFLTSHSKQNPDFGSCLKLKSGLVKRRKLRKPLRDITHLFTNQISPPIGLVQDLPAAQIAQSAFCYRKRKAADSTHQIVSKSLRMNFR
ncbi:hypothetical protein DCAR_0934253 [Daucus carota subsp. sativus]|uniref:Uncharacterized protein n=1 Tax=Daucus carota subsp. sativus TaxID=79200 RepID=A0AAF0XYA8_DAUCS|nr:hypothetical protein DCAR_0934253 [Daucus carota subsp. sativus]